MLQNSVNSYLLRLVKLRLITRILISGIVYIEEHFFKQLRVWLSTVCDHILEIVRVSLTRYVSIPHANKHSEVDESEQD